MTSIAYATLTLGIAALWGFVNGWLLYFYLPPQGQGIPLVPAALYSLIMLASRVINVLVSLPIGHLSDRTRDCWGRRLPYIFTGSAAMLGFFILLWLPPQQSESALNGVYLAVVLILFNIAYSFRLIPYEALLPELASRDAERVKISAWQAGFQFVGAILAGFAGPLIERWGYFSAALIFAAITLPALFLPFLGLRKKQLALTASALPQDFLQSLRAILQNRAFRLFLVSWGLFWMASTFILETIPFIATEICGLSKAGTVYLYLPAILISLLCFPVITWLAGRFGKQRVLLASFLASAFTLPLLLFIHKELPLPLPIQGVLWVSLQAVAMSGLQVLPYAIVAEITDHDTQITGQRRQGIYYTGWGVFDQLANGAASALLPLFLLMGSSHSQPQGPLGIRLLGVVAGVLMLAGFLIFLRYPLAQGTS